LVGQGAHVFLEALQPGESFGMIFARSNSNFLDVVAGKELWAAVVRRRVAVQITYLP
jgi:hypothetical protein